MPEENNVDLRVSGGLVDFDGGLSAFVLDPLTGLAGRAEFVAGLSPLQAGTGEYSALLVVDLDDLKLLNSAFGYATGDILLRRVAHELRRCVQDDDRIARLGDDEFGIVLRNIGTEKDIAVAMATAVGRNITEGLNKFWGVDEREYQGSVSIGILVFKAGEAYDLLRRASIAMHHAKSSGNNTLRFFDDEMLVQVIAKADLVSDLRKALLRREFFVVYQPQVDRSNHVIGFEALVRWNHPHRGLINPVEFIYSAEQSGLILPLGKWVLEVACDQLASWSRNSRTAHLTIAVNISTVQFHQETFVDEIIGVARRSGADLHKLKLELTENLLVEDFQRAAEKMGRLRAMGVCFSLDDFGTGHSSLSHLKHLSIDQLKIDMAFTADMLNNPSDAAIVRLVIELAGQFHLNVIAEGVETIDQRNFLANLGCFDCQGYLFGQPMPIDVIQKTILQQDMD